MPARFASSIKQSIQYVIYGTLQSAMQSVSVRGAGGALARSHARTLARSHALTHALTARTARSHALHQRSHTAPSPLFTPLSLRSATAHARSARSSRLSYPSHPHARARQLAFPPPLLPPLPPPLPSPPLPPPPPSPPPLPPLLPPPLPPPLPGGSHAARRRPCPATHTRRAASRSAFFCFRCSFTMDTMVPFLRVSLESTLHRGGIVQRRGRRRCTGRWRTQ